MANIFENAKFGDKFKTRNGREAIFLHNDGFTCILWVKDDCNETLCHLNGENVISSYIGDNIVSRCETVE